VIPGNRNIRRGVAGLSAVVVVVISVLAGIWLGGHPSTLPSPLRGGFFETGGLVPVDQALNILTTRYYRVLKRSPLVDHGLSGMVASLEDPYSNYLDPQAYRMRNEQPREELGGIGITTVAQSGGLRVRNVIENSPAAGAGLMPMVDHGTASSAEIVTAALQDHGRAEVVGTETYGKGVFQVTERLDNGGALDITVGKYFTPNGRNLGGGARPGSGITPNVSAHDDPDTRSDEGLAAAERTVTGETP
jgi:C-terminal processing protease CtpA/Prc